VGWRVEAEPEAVVVVVVVERSASPRGAVEAVVVVERSASPRGAVEKGEEGKFRDSPRARPPAAVCWAWVSATAAMCATPEPPQA
jgi:hypothetical protein